MIVIASSGGAQLLKYLDNTHPPSMSEIAFHNSVESVKHKSYRRKSRDVGVLQDWQPVTKIWEKLYLGSLKDAVQLARSNPRRIATVVSLSRERPVQQAPKIIYIHIPIPDARPISAQTFEDTMFAIALGVRRGNLLVHCREGMNRSPIMIAAWMDRCGYAEIDQALSEIAELRDLAPSGTLLRSVRDLLRK